MNEKKMAKILLLADKDLLNATSEELEEYEVQNNSSVEKRASLIRQKVQSNLVALKKERLKNARVAFNNKKDKEANSLLGKLVESPRKILESILKDMPQLGPALTFQNRDISLLTDEDIKIALDQLNDLGVLEEYLNKK